MQKKMHLPRSPRLRYAAIYFETKYRSLNRTAGPGSADLSRAEPSGRQRQPTQRLGGLSLLRSGRRKLLLRLQRQSSRFGPRIGSSITPTHMESECIFGAWTCLRDFRGSITSFPARCPRYRSRSQSIPIDCRAKCTKIPPCFESAKTPPPRCRIESWPPSVSLPPPTRRYSSISAQLRSL